MGSVVISVDAELGWGFHDMDDPPIDRLEAGRSGWMRLLSILDDHDVPATWGVVGHLMLEDCDGTHADLPSLEGWFDAERGRWRERTDLRFGSDLVARIVEADPEHEVASHTFSHVLFADDRVTEDIARGELQAAVDAAARFGLDYDTLIFPRNAVGHRGLLDEFDIRCYRSPRSRPSGALARAGEKLLAAVAPNRVPLVTPTVDDYGLVDIPPSLYLFGFEGWPRTLAESVGVDPIVRQAIRGIDRASREDGIFHVWLHPNDICTDRDARRIDRIVGYAAKKRSETDLKIETMATVADRVRWKAKCDEPERSLTSRSEPTDRRSASPERMGQGRPD